MKDLSQMTLAQLVELHNKHAAKPVKTFGSKADAVRRTKAVLPAGGRGKTGVTFNMPARKPVAALREDTSRAKAVALISRKGGASLAELEKKAGFKGRLNTIQGVRLLNYKQGIALKGDVSKIELA